MSKKRKSTKRGKGRGAKLELNFKEEIPMEPVAEPIAGKE